MLNPRQIRAARGLLGWEATELGKRTSLSRETIANIESGRTQAREGSLERIAQALTEAGVEFTENSGVRLKPQGVEVLQGQAGLQRFFDDVYDHARRHGGSIVQFGVDEQKFLKYLGAAFSQSYMRRMAEVARERCDLTVRAIICDGDTNFLAADYNDYRWIAKEIFKAVPFYIYGETLAIMDFETEPAPTIVLMRFPAITSAYRAQFEAFWSMGIIPNLKQPKTKSKD
jgi:transcriptional regulator with XRE-family HTH domain